MGWPPDVACWDARGAAACSPSRFRSRSTACPPLSFWVAVVAGGSGARGWLFRSWLVPCGSGDVLALLGSLVCSAALVVLRAWRPCPALRGMCAHAACPGGVPHARSATRSFRMCMFNLALLLFMFMFSDLALLCFSKRLGPRSAGGAWARTSSLLCAQVLYSCIPRLWRRGAQPQLMRSAGLIVLVRAFFAALQPHPRVSGAVGGVSQLSCACLPCCPPTASPRQWGRGGGSQQGWDIAAVHSLGCARAHGPGEQLSIRCSVCAGPVSRWARSAPLLHLVARARESARATAGPLTL